jgi:hypothetical protein
VQKQIWEIPENAYKAKKNTPKIPEIPEKFPEVHWSTSNPNKVFGAHEKDFRVF